jgi:hypothetical protein
MYVLFTRIYPIVLSLLVVGCTNTMSQEDVAREFWNAMAAKDIAKAKTFAKPGTMEGVSANEGPGVETIDLKPAKMEGGQALVPTVITGLKDGQRQTLSFNTVLEEEAGTWKVDFDKTMTSMLGFSMQDMMEGMGKAMGEAMKGMGEAIGKGLGGDNAQPQSEPAQ